MAKERWEEELERLAERADRAHETVSLVQRLALPSKPTDTETPIPPATARAVVKPTQATSTGSPAAGSNSVLALLAGVQPTSRTFPVEVAAPSGSVAQPSAVGARDETPTDLGSDALLGHLLQLRQAMVTQVDALGQNTDAVAHNTSAQNTDGRASALARTGISGSNVLGGLAAFPLLRGIGGLFHRRSEESVPASPAFQLPQPTGAPHGIAGVGGAAQPVDYDASGLPRVASPVAVPVQITVQVQALDSRSFLDRSHDIASAVRQAMLQSHGLNDVIGEL